MDNKSSKSLVTREQSVPAERETGVESSMESTMMGMVMAMVMLMFMMQMMSSMFGSVSTARRSEVGGLSWDWIIEGTEIINSGTFAGESVLPYEGSESKLWYSGTGTSGDTGADLLDIGESTDIYKIYALDVNIGYLATGSTVTVRMYKSVNGYMSKFYDYVFVVGVDSDTIPLFDSVTVIFGSFRVEIQSDAAMDDGAMIDYSAMIGVPA